MDKSEKLGLVLVALIAGTMLFGKSLIQRGNKIPEPIPVSDRLQQEYSKLQEGRFSEQLVEIPLSLDEITASFIDNFNGSNDWVTDSGEVETFLQDSGGNQVFYTVVGGVKPGASVTDEHTFTNHPFDYYIITGNLYGRTIFPTQQEAKAKAIEIELEVADQKFIPDSFKVHPAYIEVRTVSGEDRLKELLTVTGYFEREGDEFVRRKVLGFTQESRLAKLTAKPQVLLDEDIEEGALLRTYTIDDNGTNIELSIPIGHELEHVVKGGGEYFVVYSPEARDREGRRLFIGNKEPFTVFTEAEIDRFYKVRTGTVTIDYYHDDYHNEGSSLGKLHIPHDPMASRLGVHKKPTNTFRKKTTTLEELFRY